MAIHRDTVQKAGRRVKLRTLGRRWSDSGYVEDRDTEELKEKIVSTTPQSGFNNFVIRTPCDDNRERLTCADCGWIHYENPRIIVSAVVLHAGQILLCRRAIRPRYGFWTIPGGFMELGETPEQGAQREVFEEAGAKVDIHGLLAVYAVPRIGQVHLTYLAELPEPEYSAGTESLDVRLFGCRHSELPWDELAFPVNHWALRDYLSLQGKPVTQPFVATAEDLQQRMSRVEYHPDFPPPDVSHGASSSNT